jgi:hypothetical protein
MTAEERVEAALGSAKPVEVLRALVEDLAREGTTRADIYALLEKVLVRCRMQPAFVRCSEEAMLSVMDALSGWCHTRAELLPEKPAR